MIPMQTCCPVVELRQYTLHPGTRDVLVELFDREFVESQEAVGIRVLGQFRDLDDPNRFVWLRGFRDMSTRAGALAAFYGGQVWKEHRAAANATLIDWDDVLLLRPARPGSGFSLESGDRPPPGTTGIPPGLVVATICYLDEPAIEFVDFFEREVEPALPVLASFVTEPSANTYPRLPVREGENVFVWFSRFPDQAAHALAQTVAPRHEVLRLSPTAGSLLRG